MADEAEALELDTPIEVEEPVIEEGAEQQQAEEFSIEIEGEQAEPETPLVKHLRDQIRARDRQLSEKETAEKPIVVGPKPDIYEDCEGDPDRYEAALLAWHERDRAAKAQQQTQAQQAEKENHIFQQELATYQAKAAALPVADFKAMQDIVTAALPVNLQTAIVKYAKDPAKAVYALGKHPGKLATMAQETDPFKFVIAIREMEDKLVVNKRKPPEPEAQTIQSGSAALSTTVDKQADKLLADAMKPGGNMNAYRAYMKGKKG